MLAARTLLFATATRPEHVAKLPRAAPDIAVIDLEDGVAESAKAEGRLLARKGAEALLKGPDCPAVFVRINSLDRRMLTEDLTALVPGMTGVVLPKIEAPADVHRVRRALDEAGLPQLLILGGIETAEGVDRASEIAATGLCGVFFGAEDYVTDVGGRRTPQNTEVLFARSKIVLAARRAGIPALDIAVIDPSDGDRVRREMEEGLSLGFSGKVCIHPSQVAIVHDVLRPSAEELAAAERIVEAATAASAAGRGVLVVDGSMIDRPTVTRAEAVLTRARGREAATASAPRQVVPRAVSGKWFEELAVGDVIQHPITRTITEADNTIFSAMTMNPQPLHLDAEFSAASEFGERLVNSMFTLALVVGLPVYNLTLGTTVANLGFGLVEFPTPLFHGDTIRVETEITMTRESASRPTAGIVEFEHRAYNQHGVLVTRCRRQALMRKRPAVS